LTSKNVALKATRQNMIINRTPVRISFFGGGTDYPPWLEKKNGAVLSTTIDKYIYVSCRYFPPFFDYKINIAYSRIEHCNSTDQIKHPAIRECLRFMNVSSNIEINHSSDLPGRSGLGSSSAFVVGLLHCLYANKGSMISKEELVQHAIDVEHNWIKENVGYQDQYACAFGGFNLIRFNNNQSVDVIPVSISLDRIKQLQDHLLLFHTKIPRIASNVVKEQIKNIPKSTEALHKIYEMVYLAIEILNSNAKITKFGELLHKSWMLKKTLSSRISNGKIDKLYEKGLNAGAIGGKLLGAGAGGFLLMFAEASKHKKIKSEFEDLTYVPFSFENTGSRIIYLSR